MVLEQSKRQGHIKGAQAGPVLDEDFVHQIEQLKQVRHDGMSDDRPDRFSEGAETPGAEGLDGPLVEIPLRLSMD